MERLINPKFYRNTLVSFKVIRRLYCKKLEKTTKNYIFNHVFAMLCGWIFPKARKSVQEQLSEK